MIQVNKDYKSVSQEQMIGAIERRTQKIANPIELKYFPWIKSAASAKMMMEKKT
jgi:hypothetical protein